MKVKDVRVRLPSVNIAPWSFTLNLNAWSQRCQGCLRSHRHAWESSKVLLLLYVRWYHSCKPRSFLPSCSNGRALAGWDDGAVESRCQGLILYHVRRGRKRETYCVMRREVYEVRSEGWCYLQESVSVLRRRAQNAQGNVREETTTDTVA